MNSNVSCIVLATVLGLTAGTLNAEPPAKKTAQKRTLKTERQTISARALADSANGWIYVNDEWVHPLGFKFVGGKILRTTAKAGTKFPKPPGKLALDNPEKLAPKNSPAAKNNAADEARRATERAAEARRKNLAPPPRSLMGSHL